MNKWRPIEEAPTRHGAEFLVKSDYSLTDEGNHCIWHATINSNHLPPVSAVDGEPLYDATHWMPLP